MAVTADSLDNRQKIQSREEELFREKLAGLGRAIEERLLEDEAKRRGKTVQAFLGEMLDGTQAPSEDELTAALAEPIHKWRLDSVLKTAAAPEEKRGREDKFKRQVAESLKNKRFTESKAALLDSLWKQAQVEISIEDLGARRVEVPTVGLASVGPETAPLTIAVFVDFQAPSCKKADDLLSSVRATGGERVTVLYKHHPSQMRPLAARAAEAASCAAFQGKFPEYKDRLFSKPTLEAADFDRFATEISLDKAAFDSCLAGGEGKKVVEADAELARKLGVRNVPAFFVNGIPIHGLPSALELRVLVEGELRARGKLG